MKLIFLKKILFLIFDDDIGLEFGECLPEVD